MLGVRRLALLLAVPAAGAAGADAPPVDPLATPDAARLLDTLRSVGRSEALIFGHHNTNMQGQRWQDNTGALHRSDVAAATGGRWPGMYGYNLDGVARGRGAANFSALTAAMRGRGAVLHMFWQANNPVTGGSAHDLNGSPITAILPGGSANVLWRRWMDNVADFFHTIGVPAIFRPFHENTGGWFWWGSASATPEQYRAAWNYTCDYIVQTRGVHNILLAFAPSKPTQSPESWQLAYGDGPGSTYPGDDRVDIACFDHYGPDDYHAALISDCEAVVGFAQSRGKVPAICESGVKGGTQNTNKVRVCGLPIFLLCAMVLLRSYLPLPQSGWWTEDFLDPIAASSGCSRVAFTYLLRAIFPAFSPFPPSCPQDSGNRHQDPEKRSETAEKRRAKPPKLT